MKIKSHRKISSQAGFTLVEVLVATVIFVLAIIAIVESQKSSQRNIAQSERYFTATSLGRLKMTEMVLKYQKAVNQNGVASSFGTDSGTFDAPYQEYQWKAELKEFSMEMTPEEVSKFMQSLGVDEETAQEQVEQQRLILTNLNKVLKENYAELVVKIEWEHYGRKYNLPLVTHVIPQKPKIEFTTVAE